MLQIPAHIFANFISWILWDHNPVMLFVVRYFGILDPVHVFVVRSSGIKDPAMLFTVGSSGVLDRLEVLLWDPERP